MKVKRRERGGWEGGMPRGNEKIKGKKKGRRERRKEWRRYQQFSGSLTAQGFSIELTCKR